MFDKIIIVYYTKAAIQDGKKDYVESQAKHHKYRLRRQSVCIVIFYYSIIFLATNF